MQAFGDTVTVTYTLLIRAVDGATVVHRSHNETRVFPMSEEKTSQ